MKQYNIYFLTNTENRLLSQFVDYYIKIMSIRSENCTCVFDNLKNNIEILVDNFLGGYSDTDKEHVKTLLHHDIFNYLTENK